MTVNHGCLAAAAARVALLSPSVSLNFCSAAFDRGLAYVPGFAALIWTW